MPSETSEALILTTLFHRNFTQVSTRPLQIRLFLLSTYDSEPMDSALLRVFINSVWLTNILENETTDSRRTMLYCAGIVNYVVQLK
jgi:hypothetical protein